MENNNFERYRSTTNLLGRQLISPLKFLMAMILRTCIPLNNHQDIYLYIPYVGGGDGRDTANTEFVQQGGAIWPR